MHNDYYSDLEHLNHKITNEAIIASMVYDSVDVTYHTTVTDTDYNGRKKQIPDLPQRWLVDIVTKIKSTSCLI